MFGGIIITKKSLWAIIFIITLSSMNLAGCYDTKQQSVKPDSTKLDVAIEKIDTSSSKIDPRQIDKNLGIDIVSVFKSIFLQSSHMDDNAIQSLSIEAFERVNLSRTDGTKNDFIIVGEYQTKFYKDDRMVMLIYVQEKNELLLKYVFNQPVTRFVYELRDLDSDNVSEIIINSRSSGNSGAYHGKVGIIKYCDHEFKSIFEQDLSAGTGITSYSYKNEYYFRKDENDPKLFNIVFRVKTVFDETVLVERSNLPNKIEETIVDEVIYRFNGTRYVPNKEVYDFKGWLKENRNRQKKSF